MLLAQSLKLALGVEVEQGGVFVPNIRRDFLEVRSVLQHERVSASAPIAPAAVTVPAETVALDVLILRKVGLGRVRYNLHHFLHCGVEMLAVDVLVLGVGIVVAGRKVHRRHAERGSDERDVAERTPFRFKPLARDVLLKLRVIAVVVNGVVPALAVNLDQHFQAFQLFLREFPFLETGAERARPDAPDFLITGEQQPRLDRRLLVDRHEGVNAAAVIAADSLRGHQDAAVLRLADVLHRGLVNRVEVGHQHNRSLSANKDITVLANRRAAFEPVAQLGKQFFLGGHQEIF